MSHQVMLIRRILLLAIMIACARPLAAQGKKITWEDHVRPILRENCAGCHNAERRRADLDLTSYTSLLTGSSSGEIVSAGDPSSSQLWLSVSHEEEPHMPPRKPRLPEKQLAILRAWIEGGVLETRTSTAGKPDSAGPEPVITIMPAAPVPGRATMPGLLRLEPFVLSDRAGAVLALDHSPAAPLLAVGGQEQVLLIETRGFELRGILPFEEGTPQCLRFSRDGTRLLVAGGQAARAGLTALYDVESGRRLATLGDELDVVLSADVTPDLERVALGGPGRVVRVLAFADGKVAYRIKKHTDWVTAIAFSPDGVLLASGDRGGGVILTEARSGERFHELRGHRSGITQVSWRADGNVLATSSRDRTVRLWDVESGKQIRSFTAHASGTEDVRFASDGRLVTCGRDRKVKIWNSGGKLLKTFESMPGIALRASITNDGRTVMAGDLLGTLRAWRISDRKRVADLSTNPPALEDRIAALTRRLVAEDVPTSAARLGKAARRTAAGASKALEAARKKRKELQGRLSGAKQKLARLNATAAANVKFLEDVEKRLPGLRERMKKEEASLPVLAERRRAADLERRAAGGLLESRRLLQQIQKNAANEARRAADASQQDPALGEAARLAEASAAKLQEAVALAGQAHSKASAAALAAEKAWSGARKARDGAAKDVARLERLEKEKMAFNARAVEDRAKLDAAIGRSEGQLAVLRGPIAALEGVVRRASKQAKGATELADKLDGVTSGLARWQAGRAFVRLQEARAALDQLKAEQAQRMEDLEQVREAAAGTAADVRKAESSLADDRGRTSAAQAAVARCRAAWLKVKQKLDRAKTAVSALKDRRPGLVRKLVPLRRNLEARERSLKLAGDRRQQAMREQEEAEADHERHVRRVEEARAALAANRKACADGERALRQRLGDLEAARRAARANPDDADALQRLGAADRAHKEQAETVRKLEKARGVLAARIESLDDGGAGDRRIRQLRSGAAEAEKHEETARSAREAAAAELEASSSETRRSEEQLGAARAERREAAVRAQTALRDIAAARRALLRCTDAERELKPRIEQAVKVARAVAARVTALEDAVVAARKAISDQARTVRALEKEHAAARVLIKE